MTSSSQVELKNEKSCRPDSTFATWLECLKGTYKTSRANTHRAITNEIMQRRDLSLAWLTLAYYYRSLRPRKKTNCAIDERDLATTDLSRPSVCWPHRCRHRSTRPHANSTMRHCINRYCYHWRTTSLSPFSYPSSSCLSLSCLSCLPCLS